MRSIIIATLLSTLQLVSHSTKLSSVTAKNVQYSCGRRLVKLKTLISHGSPTNEGDWPWAAAIFRLSGPTSSYICGGSLLNSNTVLTAAHCVYQNGQVIIPQRVRVHLGKYYLHNSGRHTQELQAYEVIPHFRYDIASQQNDIAIIRLATEATFDDYVQPLCLWESKRIDFSEVINKFGTVTGWGLMEIDELSDTIQQAVIPVVPFTTCLQSNRDVFGALLSDTNFCAGFRNGTNACNGDSGGSLTFEENGVYFIRGIVSSIPARDKKGLCSMNDYVIFTDVAKYLSWIQEEVPQLKLINKTPVRTCGRRLVQLEEPITETSTSKEGYWPWYARISTPRQKEQGVGALISSNVILTTAESLNIFPFTKKDVSVTLGIFNNADRHRQVEELIPHPNYDAFNELENDIGIIRLSSEATLNDYVQPICLWDSTTIYQSEVLNKIGAIPIEVYRSEPFPNDVILNHVSTSVLLTETCSTSNHTFNGPLISSTKFCAQTHGGLICPNKGGFPISFEKNGVAYIRGVMSVERKNSRFCPPNVLHIFTDIAKYLTWIKEVVPELADIP